MNQLGTDRSLLEELVADSADLICIVNRDATVVIWNAQMQETFGISKETAIGLPIDALVNDLSYEPYTTNFKRALLGQGLISRQFFCIKKIWSYFQPSFSPVRLSNDQPGVMIILRKVEKEWIYNHESRFKPLIEESPIATAIYRLDGRPKYFNKAYGAIWGAASGTGEKATQIYNILEDEQLKELGVMPFIQRAFAGERTDLPPIPYNPNETSVLKDLGLNEKKYVKGHIFPIKDEAGEMEEVVLVISDITFQKQAEQILTETHLKFQMLTMGLPGVIYEYVIDSDGECTFKYISQGCQEMFGYSPEEIMENSELLNECIHEDDLSGYIESCKKSQESSIEWIWEGRIIVNGQEKWIEGKSSPTKMKDGTVVRYGLLLDITEKKEVEKRYKLTAERLNLALQGAELGLWEWNVDDRKTIFNDSWAHKFGYDPQELEQHFEDWAKLIHPDDLPEVRDKLHQHLAGNTQYFEAEYRFLTKEGKYRWILDKGRAVKRDQTGKVIKAAGTYLDINERKNSQMLVKRSEQLFTQLFENSPMGIVLLDENHQVVQMNQGFLDLFGYNKQDIIGNKLNNIIVPDELAIEAMDINMLTASGRVGMLESNRMRKDGELIPVIIYGVPVTFENKTIGIYGIYVDITDRKRAENELQIRNNELDNFVYKVSHDLRAPLSSILGLVHLANHEQNEDSLVEYIGLIENRIKQLDSFINDVLSHSKNLKLDLTVAPIDFEKIVQECYDDLGYLPNAEKVKRITTIDHKPFYSDVWRINEIFRNMISNAIKYLNPEIDDPFVRIDIKVDKYNATITFEDNGIGIEEDTLPKVFEMFYRATEYSQGSGIGLYIVKNAIEKLNGTIGIHSEPFKGTTFKITLPNKEALSHDVENG